MLKQLWNNAVEHWKNLNIEFLGLDSVNESWPIHRIQWTVENSAKYWNSGNCWLVNNFVDKDIEQRQANSFSLTLNTHTMCVDVYAIYDERRKVMSLPLPTIDLNWIIYTAKYTPKITASKSKRIKKIKNVVVYPTFTYHLDSNLFTYAGESLHIETAFSQLDVPSIITLETFLKEKLTINNFEKAMQLLPEFSMNSVFNYDFDLIDRFKRALAYTKEYAQPTKNRIFGVNKIFVSKRKNKDLHLCITKTKLEALATLRTVENVYKAEFIPKFQYSDTVGYFDAFRTSTSKHAGRQRLLLDDVIVKNTLLYIGDKNMFEAKSLNTISVLSEAPFCYNNKPKRIMMNAKMKAQAVPLKDELCNLSHYIHARACFAELEGYTFSDALVISESFAKRLATTQTEFVYLNPMDAAFRQIEKSYNTLNSPNLKALFPTRHDAILSTYENVYISNIEYLDVCSARVKVVYTIPFLVGDKLTNFHGAKGVVSKILPDNQMPKLLNNFGKMEAGPVEIVFSTHSMLKRGAYGQVFEAYANCIGDESKFAQDVMAKDIDLSTIVEYKGQQISTAVGILGIMRLYHDATTHLTTYSSRLGEMEQLNLLANGCENILDELSQRGKSVNAFYEIIKALNYEVELHE